MQRNKVYRWLPHARYVTEGILLDKRRRQRKVQAIRIQDRQRDRTIRVSNKVRQCIAAVGREKGQEMLLAGVVNGNPIVLCGIYLTRERSATSLLRPVSKPFVPP